MIKISYRVVVCESDPNIPGDADQSFCKTEVKFTSENPYKARTQALAYLNSIRDSAKWAGQAFIQFLMTFTDEGGRKETLILSNGYPVQDQAHLKEENLEIERKVFRTNRMAAQLPSPTW